MYENLKANHRKQFGSARAENFNSFANFSNNMYPSFPYMFNFCFQGTNFPSKRSWPSNRFQSEVGSERREVRGEKERREGEERRRGEKERGKPEWSGVSSLDPPRSALPETLCMKVKVADRLKSPHGESRIERSLRESIIWRQ